MSFSTLCREADRRQRRQPVDPRIARARRLLADNTTIDRVDAELRADRLRGRAAESTVDALVFSLRSGVAALKRSDVLRRLSELSDAQLRDVAVRLQKFESGTMWTSTDIKILVAVRGRHGKDARANRR